MENNNKLTVVIPVYNEERTLHIILKKVCSVKLIHNYQKEIIIVNDCSVDRSEEEILKFIENNPEFEFKYIRHEKNQGKGAALHTGIRNASGKYLVIQDADLEYDPDEYNILLKPAIDGYAD